MTSSTEPSISFFIFRLDDFLNVHVHVRIHFHFIHLLSHLGVFSRLSSLSDLFNLHFLKFLALVSRLSLILDFDMEFFRSHEHHTGSDSCLSIPLSLCFFFRLSSAFLQHRYTL